MNYNLNTHSSVSNKTYKKLSLTNVSLNGPKFSFKPVTILTSVFYADVKPAVLVGGFCGQNKKKLY
jgi:hypothetical protein